MIYGDTSGPPKSSVVKAPWTNVHISSHLIPVPSLSRQRRVQTGVLIIGQRAENDKPGNFISPLSESSSSFHHV